VQFRRAIHDLKPTSELHNVWICFDLFGLGTKLYVTKKLYKNLSMSKVNLLLAPAIPN